MKKPLRHLALGLMLALLLLTACGCSLTFSPQELYRLPKLPAEYTGLDSQLDEILTQGAELAPPASGVNTQPVQIWDLDGDGKQEAIAFFRNPSDEKPLKIYIFTAEDQSYEQSAVIEGSGTGFYSMAYSDFNADGVRELLVGWRVNTDLQALSVYTLRSGRPEELMSSYYVKYAVVDLDQDGILELVVLRSDDETGGAADYYKWQDSGLVRRATIRISSTMAELNQQGRVTKGKLQDGTPALFITGVSENSRTITDILVVRGGELTNLVLSDSTGVSREIAAFRNLYPMDIDGDGITDVPRPLDDIIPEGDRSGICRRIDWYHYDIKGKDRRVMSTYHETEDGWYLRLPEKWEDRITAAHTVGSGESVITFYILGVGDEDPPKEFLKIYTLTGSNREIKAGWGNRFSLIRQTSTIYAAELLEANDTWIHGVTEDEVRTAFNLITSNEWGADN